MAIGEYISTLVISAAVGGIAVSLAHSSVRRPTRCAVGVLVLFAVLVPLGGIAASITEIAASAPTADIEVGTERYEKAISDTFERGIAVVVSEKFGISVDAADVTCYGFSSERMRADAVRIRLRGTAALADLRSMRDYICEGFTDGGRCEFELLAQ